MAPPTVTPAIKPALVERCLDSTAAVGEAEAAEDKVEDRNVGVDLNELTFAEDDVVPDEVDIGVDSGTLPVPADSGEQFWATMTFVIKCRLGQNIAYGLR